ncbi:MAG: isochorismatase family protein [Coriobacteriia bacterium]
MTPTSDHVIRRDDVALLVVDVQERLAAVMPRRAEVVAATSLLMRTAELLGIPIIATRQNPGGLGPIVPEIAGLVTSIAVDKLSFDCMAEDTFVSALQGTGRRQVVLVGMEAHICVAQTALALLAAGYSVHVVADAVCSRRDTDRDVALARLRHAGVEVTTAEAVAFEAVGEAGTGEFRAALALVKDRDAS